MTVAGLTPFQTVGPYFHLGLHDGVAADGQSTDGAMVAITGRLLDGAGTGIPEGVLEFWVPGWTGIVRAYTDADGWYRLKAARPASRPGADGTTHAAHFVVRVLGRGILTEYITRLYVAGDADLDADPVLRRVPADRRGTLMAATTADGYRFDIVVQGDRETVFFEA